MSDSRGLERWWVLAAFFVANALPEFLWSNFPPIMTIVADKYGIGPAAASLPIISFSIGTMLSASIAGRVIDQRGYQFSVRIGLLMLAAFSALRVVDGPFWLLVAAQCGIGAAFSFVAASTSSYVVDWFEERHVALVTGICVIGLYAGLGSSMIVTPAMVASVGFSGMMKATAAASSVVLAVGYLLIRQRRPVAPAAAQQRSLSMAEILRNRTLSPLMVMSFLMGGAFSAVATALEPAWSGRGFSLDEAGLANGLFIFGGIAGSFLMPMLEARLGSGKRVLVLCAVAALVFTYPLLAAPSPLIGNIIAVIVGIFWLGNVPVCLTVMERSAGAAHAGAASGAFWAVNNLGTISLVWLAGVITEYSSWRAAAVAMLLLLAVNQGAAFALPRDDRPRDPCGATGNS